MDKRIAFLFPGQGSQVVGMGRDLVAAFPEARSVFDQVDDVCQKPLSKLCFEGPMDALTLTENLQPAIAAVSLACLAVLKTSGVEAWVSAGHSLGEYAGLVSSGVVSAYDALKLVQKRGALMHREALAHPGSMAAVVGMDMPSVQHVVDHARNKGILAIANHNTADQIVITGDSDRVTRAVALVKQGGGKAIPLKVSGAWHCGLMEGAVQEFRDYMAAIPFSEPRSRMLFNATAAPETDPETIKDIMAKQLISPVLWYDIMVCMLGEGVTTFVEVGPKKVLTGLLKKTVTPDHPVHVYNVEDAQSLRRFVEENA